MIIKKTSIDEVLLITPKIHHDERGYFYESFNNREFLSFTGKSFVSVQDNHSFSKKGTLRGIHFQVSPMSQAKVVQVVDGQIYDVAVDLRKNSKTFGKYYSLIITDKSEYSFYVPEGFAHGFLCLSDKCVVHYKCSEYRHKESETTLHWRDQKVKIKWPIKKPILSKKDKIGKNLDFFR